MGGVGKEGNMATNKPDFFKDFWPYFQVSQKEKITFGKIFITQIYNHNSCLFYNFSLIMYHARVTVVLMASKP
jgi:hypothetical protein